VIKVILKNVTVKESVDKLIGLGYEIKKGSPLAMKNNKIYLIKCFLRQDNNKIDLLLEESL
jgi:hypothetical protein